LAAIRRASSLIVALALPRSRLEAQRGKMAKLPKPLDSDHLAPAAVHDRAVELEGICSDCSGLVA